MSKFLRKAFPFLALYAAAGLVKIGLDFMADAFEMDTNGALFFFLVWLFEGLCASAIFWNLGSLAKSKFSTLCRIMHILSAWTYVLGVVLTFINIFCPISWLSGVVWR